MNNEDKSNSQNIDVVRAWKDEEYRNSLTPEQLATIPPNPAGELSEEELNGIDGGTYKFIVPPGGGGVRPQSLGPTCLVNTSNLLCHIV